MRKVSMEGRRARDASDLDDLAGLGKVEGRLQPFDGWAAESDLAAA
jgi:hypothetical protein